jgi:CubicO group peptidase (beta-lactamase class C family)
MRKNSLLWLLSLLFFIHTIYGQNKAAGIDEVMKTFHRFNMFDGSILVAENGKVVYKKGFGLANHEWNVPNKPDTKFMIGSVSKQFTAMLVLLQAQKGLIKLDNTISDYIPEFSTTNGKRITIRQLLSHTSGMPNYEIIPDFFPKISRQYSTREDYIKLYMDSALLSEPGKEYHYSSWGYYTLGYIAEKVTGKTYAALLKEEIFDKLGMKGSGSYFHTQIISNRATGYDYALDGYTSSDFRDQSNTMGTGDMYSTVEDLFKWHLALSNYSLLNKQLTGEMFTRGLGLYGYGWFNYPIWYTAKDSVLANYHLGMTDGFLSFIARIPETNSLVVILCNSSPTDFFAITRAVLRVLYAKSVPLKQPVYKVLEKSIPQKGIQAAMLQYESLKKDTAHYYVTWWDNDRLGNELYNLGRYDDAIIILSKTAEEFPGKYIVLNSLAKSYEKAGNKQEAIATYKKALDAEPGNEEAKGKLKILGMQ